MNTTNQNDSNNIFRKHPVKNFSIGFLIIFMFLIGHSLLAQVGVGNTNPQAQLDISASNATSPTNTDGILIPRVSNLPSVFSMTANQDGMMVFYTGTGEDGKGFYYWDEPANNWVKIVSGTANDWSLNGNAINGTNFFGTTNNLPIRFRTNNIEQMVLDQDGDLGLNQTNPNATLDIGFTNGKNVIEARGNSTILAPTTIVSNISGATSGNSNEIENGMIQTFTTPQDGELNYIDFFARGSSNGNQDTRIIIRRNGTIIYNNVFSVSYSTAPVPRRINFPAGITITTSFTYSVEFEDESYGWATPEIYGYYSTGNTYNNGNASGTAPTSGDLAIRININRFISTTDEVFVLNEDGQLSIGHDNPSATLDIVGDFQYRDGNESTGNILISDNSGNATWTDPTSIFTDTDDQTLTLSGNFLSITDGNSVNLSSLFNEDSDWYEVGGTTIPNDINDNIYTQGNVGIGETTPSARLHVNGGTIPLLVEVSGTETMRLNNNTLEFLDTNESVFLGQEVGLNQTATGERNTGVGAFAMRNLSNGQNNTAVGYAVLDASATGSYNTGVGAGAFSANVSGDWNVALGSSALANLTSGEGNVAVGYQTLATATNTVGNNALGYRALASNTNGFGNSAFGYQSLENNTTADRNVAFGNQTLRYQTSQGFDNSAFGYYALQNNTSGDNNVAIGKHAGLNNITGGNNTFIGTDAGENSTGSGNVYIGYQAGSNNTASNKLFIDNSSGDQNNALIYGDFNSNILRANGEFQIQQNSQPLAGIAHLNFFETEVNDGSRIKFRNSVETNNYWTIYSRTDNTHPDSRFTIFYNNISGTGTGSNLIEMTGEGRVGIRRTPTTNNFEVNGNASKNVAGAWLANSDRRLKKNIKTIDGENALNKLLALRGVTYEWNDDQTGIDRPKNIQYGFIAQELMQVFPGKVTKDNLGFYQTAYGDYDAVFVQAIKELNSKIETLEAENIILKQQLKKYESLEARILALENATETNSTSVQKGQTSEK
ncbi:hypothetical protein BWZ20_10435 [Winogradskyella sp. J14-2]|uniref:tail fiber domain-containing protein n=1 Tax=Winogradskyella sp. J14-2 TaxID=1936080 RepID=UPI000972C8D3|nr:tail fiber domain-containing protein [Winogradskyella sp. J14-2]APY08694.1 hypothetical protein BWZ20_10435 [Winogradskyella sp. J14-2]